MPVPQNCGAKCPTMRHSIKNNKQACKAFQRKMSHLLQKNFSRNESFQPQSNFLSESRKPMKQHLNFQEIPPKVGMTALIKNGRKLETHRPEFAKAPFFVRHESTKPNRHKM